MNRSAEVMYHDLLYQSSLGSIVLCRYFAKYRKGEHITNELARGKDEAMKKKKSIRVSNPNWIKEIISKTKSEEFISFINNCKEFPNRKKLSEPVMKIIKENAQLILNHQ
eukprot:10770765-Ditylum_brightwellii.AAC.1